MVWMASRMLVIMNGSDQTGGLNAFMRVFSCAGVLASAGACSAWMGAGAMWIVDGDMFRGDLR
jgi:hypothetical protein